MNTTEENITARTTEGSAGIEGAAGEVWFIPGPHDMLNSLGWPVVVLWLYVCVAALYTILVAVRIVAHLSHQYRRTQLVVNTLAVLSYPVTAALNAAVVVDPRYEPLLNVVRDLWVGSHLALIGLTLLSNWDGPGAFTDALQRIWHETRSSYPPTQYSAQVQQLRTRFWWLMEPERDARVFSTVSLLCLLQYPLLLLGIQTYLLSGIVRPLFADPDHYLWTGPSPALNAIATMSFWLCFIGRNNFYRQPFPLLEWGDVMRDRERTLFLLIDFNWLQGMVAQLFPRIGLRLPGMNEYTTFSVLLHALIVVQMAMSVLRVDRFWREPMADGSVKLAPIDQRCAARDLYLARNQHGGLARDRRDSELGARCEETGISPPQPRSDAEHQSTHRRVNIIFRRRPS